jgi:hypothetical protein
LIALNGRGPPCHLQDEPQGMDHQLGSEKIYPPHKPKSGQNQELTDQQARWLTRRFFISSAMAAAIAPLAFPGGGADG